MKTSTQDLIKIAEGRVKRLKGKGWAQKDFVKALKKLLEKPRK